MIDALRSERRFRTSNIVDNFKRECLAIKMDTSLGGGHVLEDLKLRRGLPQ